MSVKELNSLLLEGKLSCEELLVSSLNKISANDKQGRCLNAVCEIDSNCWFYARALDKELKENGPRSLLHGIPVLVKDNIDVKGLHTTANSYALNDNIAAEDSFLVKQLRAAGANVIGKANLSEFAYFMSRQGMPSGFGSMNGQVSHSRCPGYDPSGSSSGSGVAAAAGYTPVTVGTETDGSLMSPAISNAIVAIKPTVGLVSRTGILPISLIQDTAGPMARSVADCAALLNYMTGIDDDDIATYDQVAEDYTSYLKDDLKGMKVGLFKASDVEFKDEYEQYYQNAKEYIIKRGGEVKEIVIEKGRVDEMEALMHEFKSGLNVYLNDHFCACRSLKDIIEFNKANADRCLVHGQDILEGSEEKSGFMFEAEYLNTRNELKAYTEGTLNKLFEDVDCLVSVCGLRKTNLAPVSGYPCMSVPVYVSSNENYTPISYYFIGKKYGEGEMIRVAYNVESENGVDLEPEWCKQ